jgi:hypothetical protein
MPEREPFVIATRQPIDRAEVDVVRTGVRYGDVLDVIRELVIVAARELLRPAFDADRCGMHAIEERAENPA